MRFVALAAGFDGTLARDGRFDERCLDALRALAATGRKLILVTARELRELLEIFPQARVFDYVIAENGAVMYQPATRQSKILAQAPSEILLQELERRGIAPLAVGSSIVTTSLANEPEVRDALSKLRLDCQLVANDEALIILPTEVNKASGVKEALRQLGISAHNLAVIGDAENDLALFRLAEHAVAVQNADDTTKSCADRTTRGEYCEGFLELARDLTDSDLSYAQPKARVPLGLRNGHEEIALGPYYDSLLVCGPPGSGKAALCNRVLEQLLARGYQCCVVGANVSDGSTVSTAITIFGDAHEAPRLSEILSALEQPNTSVTLNLAALPAESRPVFVDALLVQLQALHDRVGRPHVIVMQQAHWFMTSASNPMVTARLSEMTRIYVTTDPERLPLEILESVSTAIALGDNATMPSQFSGFGAISRLDVGQPSKLTQNRTPLAQVWIRAQHSQRALQAIAEGATCDIPRSREPDSTSVASTDEVSSFSG